jgi:hypothetical protein
VVTHAFEIDDCFGMEVDFWCDSVRSLRWRCPARSKRREAAI